MLKIGYFILCSMTNNESNQRQVEIGGIKYKIYICQSI